MKNFTIAITLPFAVLLASAVFITSCSDDSSTNNPTPTGPVLLATVSGDSVATSLGVSTKTSSISGQELDFTDRDSAEISFTYSGSNNNIDDPIVFYYRIDTLNYIFHTPTVMTLDGSDHTYSITIPSPKVKHYFYYRIRASTSGGFCYYKFKDLKIYKK